MDKHKRPHKCEYPGCTTPPFGDKSTLIRHRREVHDSRNEGRSAGDYCCPAPSCERQYRGFARRWNLLEHLRRMHNSEEQDGQIVLLPNREHLAAHTAATQMPSPPASLSSPPVATTTIAKTLAANTLPQQPIRQPQQPFVLDTHSVCTKRPHEESSGYHRDESLQAKLRRKEADRKKIDAEKQKLDQEIRVLREALAIV
ncbi:MAG: hypothetical protein M1813_004948 [Trichoglossum hirsutum]|jgi:hypothetical protein|nr:MAG: hypothetical protein M1813_004948 [Trichoglossum hirsutum]